MGLEPMVRLAGYEVAVVAPSLFGIGPIPVPIATPASSALGDEVLWEPSEKSGRVGLNDFVI